MWGWGIVTGEMVGGIGGVRSLGAADVAQDAAATMWFGGPGQSHCRFLVFRSLRSGRGSLAPDGATVALPPALNGLQRASFAPPGLRRSARKTDPPGLRPGQGTGARVAGFVPIQPHHSVGGDNAIALFGGRAGSETGRWEGTDARGAATADFARRLAALAVAPGGHWRASRQWHRAESRELQSFGLAAGLVLDAAFHFFEEFLDGEGLEEDALESFLACADDGVVRVVAEACHEDDGDGSAGLFRGGEEVVSCGVAEVDVAEDEVESLVRVAGDFPLFEEFEGGGGVIADGYLAAPAGEDFADGCGDFGFVVHDEDAFVVEDRIDFADAF